MSALRKDDAPIIAKMALGHLLRTGHALVAHLESNDGEVWHVVRECCKDGAR